MQKYKLIHLILFYSNYTDIIRILQCISLCSVFYYVCYLLLTFRRHRGTHQICFFSTYYTFMLFLCTSLQPHAKMLFEELGATMLEKLDFRDVWAFVGQKGIDGHSTIEDVGVHIMFHHALIYNIHVPVVLFLP